MKLKFKIVMFLLCLVGLMINNSYIISNAEDMETMEIVSDEEDELNEESLAKEYSDEETNYEEITTESLYFDNATENDEFETTEDNNLVNEESVGDNDNLLAATYIDEAVNLTYDTKLSYAFKSGVAGRKSYKVSVDRDAILSFNAKGYATNTGSYSDDDDIYIFLYDANGKKLLTTHDYIYKSKGFVSLENICCISKGVYYLVVENCYDTYTFGKSYSYIGEDSFELEAHIDYPKSNELENNDNFINAQSISGKEKQYGAFPFGDRFDTYKIIVENSGSLKINFEGHMINDKTSFLIDLYDFNGNRVKSFDADYSSNYGCSIGELNISVSSGIYYIQIDRIGTMQSRQGYYTLSVTLPGNTKPMYRLYNPNSGEHFYTASVDERDYLSKIGWNYEGIAWNAPAYSDTPVYRLYNPNAGDHHYTTSVSEKNHLIKVGWSYEGIGWYSYDSNGQALYRLYNPNATGAGSHHYTTNKAEKDNLVKVGWSYEGIAWYGSY